MKRLALLLTAALFAGLLALVPASPAAADTGVCAGVGTATVTTSSGKGLLYPLSVASPGSFTALRSASFGYQLDPGVCVTVEDGVVINGASASGTVNGWCGLSEGDGQANGHGISFIGIGGLLVVTGEAIGAVVAVPNVVDGQTCSDLNSDQGASKFVIVGGALSQHATPCRINATLNGPPPTYGFSLAC